MDFIKSYKKEILISLTIIALYFFTRLVNIMHLPIFTDEAIYVRWSQIAKQDASWRFISLTDGKQPMYVWIAVLVMGLIKDPLFAGRLVSVGSGFVSMVGLFVLGREMFKNKWIGFVSAALYCLYPFALVYDRMAMYDSMVGTFLIWGVYVEVLLARRVKAYLAFVVALVVGGGMLTKTNAFFNWYFLPFGALLLDWKGKEKWNRFFHWAAFAALAGVLAYLYYSILRLSPYFGIIAQKNYSFIYSPHEFLQHPFMVFVGNLHGLFNWFITYTNWLGFGLALASFFVLRRFWREKLILVAWSLLPFLALTFDAKIIYPRYILPMAIFFLPLMALTLFASFSYFSKTIGKLVGILLLVLIFSSYLYVDWFIMFDFVHAPIADSDINQYSNAWPAGGGVNEMVAFFKKQSQNQKIFVASEGTFGSVPTLAVEIYLDSNKNVEKQGIYPIPQQIPKELLQKAKTMPTYIVFEQTQTPPLGWPLTFIAKYQKGIGNWYLSIYKITAQ